MGDLYEIFKDGQNKPIDRFEVRDLRKQTRFAVDNYFIDKYTNILGPSVSMVYMSLVRHSNKGQKTWPSQKLIAQEVGIGRQWVSTSLSVLQFFNLIRSVRVGKRCTNRYYLVDEKYWRVDFNAMLDEVETQYDPKDNKLKVMSSETTSSKNNVMSSLATSPIGDIKCLQRLHQMLSKATSNRKDKESKDKQERDTTGKIVKRKSLQRADRVDVPKRSPRYEYTYDKERNVMVQKPLKD